MKACSVLKRLRIVRGGMKDYERLAVYHYREGKLKGYAAIFAMKLGDETVGVIVYTMPSPGLELRNIALGDIFCGFDRASRMALVNKMIRCIGRVVIEPRLRGLGLASMLVRETMGRIDVPIIEAAAVMGMVNPFFEKAGMTAYRAKMPVRSVQLSEAFSAVGIEEAELIEPQEVQRKIDVLGGTKAEFIEREVRRFLQSYGKSRYMKSGAERTRFVLNKLTDRPVYYVWFNRNMERRDGNCEKHCSMCAIG